MGVTQLPNGQEYFSVSEEFSSFFELIFDTVNSVHIGVFLILTVVFVALLFLLILYQIKRQAREVAA